MNIIFFGSSQFAVPTLKALLETAHKISCVVTQPDRQKGRGLHFEGTAVKTTAEAGGLKVYQPTSVNVMEAVRFLKDLNPDLFIVISYGQILSQEVLDIPKIFSLNIHASLLPKYRGAAPINRALIKGEKATGITIIKMTQKMDAGAIIMQKELGIEDDDTAITLEDKLSKISAELLVMSLNPIENNTYALLAQDEKEASFAGKLKKEDGLIKWDKPACSIHNLVRAVLVWPGAFTYHKGKLLKIYKTRVIPLSRYPVVPSPGKIMEVSKDGVVVATGKDYLSIEELQLEGKRRMKVEEFIAGHKIFAGEILGKKIIA